MPQGGGIVESHRESQEEFMWCLPQYLILWCFFQATGLHFRHTDNVIQWLNAMDEIGLPKVTSLVFISSWY